MDFIQGDRFKDIVDFQYAPEMKSPSAYDHLENTLNTSELKGLNIIYTHTFYVQRLFLLIASLKQRFIIITHNADTEVNHSFKLPKNVLKWHSQNINIHDSRIVSIPIGIENDRWLKMVDKKGMIIEKVRDGHHTKNLLYVNHNVLTNPKKREGIYELFEDKKWVTVEKGKNGHNFEEYLDNMYNHKFMICPEGNGIDTHRLWETLYLTTIPIVKRNINNQYYKDLPICFVNDWKEITEDFLKKEYVRIKQADWNMRMLTFEYWKNKILNEFN